MTLLAIAFLAAPAFAGGGGGAGEVPDKPQDDVLDGLCWTCEIELTFLGCDGPAYRDVTFQAEATSAQGCADALYTEIDDHLSAFGGCIEEVRDDEFQLFTLTQGSVNQRVSLMEFDPNQDVLECDSSEWEPILQASDKDRP